MISKKNIKTKPLAYDYTFLLKKSVGKFGVEPVALKKLSSKMAPAHQAKEVAAWVRELNNHASLATIVREAEQVRKHFKNLLVIGIGGSDLGSRALQQAFSHRQRGVKVFFLGDTTDPIEINKVLGEIDLKQTAINVVSKSGSTVEVLATFFYVRKQLVQAVGKALHHAHIYITTDSNDSPLNELVELHDYTWLEHPLDIGGRWSILTVVALFSAACSGINIMQLVQGGREFYNRAVKNAANPALIYAAGHYLGLKQGLNQAVLMPYSQQLAGITQWQRQLFAESLGKAKNRRGETVNVGLTPVSALGPRDQHSQAQLYMEGPFDKLITFIRVNTLDANETVPTAWPGEVNVKFLDNRRLDDILKIEQVATALALKTAHRPNGTIILDQISEEQIGQLLVFFQLACVYLAELMDINAFDQPGVESGKKNMLALLDAKGYEKHRQELVKFLNLTRKNIAK